MMCLELLKGIAGMTEATIDGLAFPNRSSREPMTLGQKYCFEASLWPASYAAAEKGGEGTALKT
jgi:hypothetical protein